MSKLINISFLIFSIIFSTNAQDDFLYFVNEANEAIYSRLNIIENAKHELFVSYYIFETDDIGMFFLALLIDKKEKNPQIDIKLLLDANGCKINRKYLYYCEQKGIEIKEFHSIPKILVPLEKISIPNFILAVQNFNMRMHDKFIIADSIAFITGGRNIEKSYFGMDVRNFNDRDVYFYSHKLASDVREYYLNLWNSNYVQKISYFIKHKSNRNFKNSEKILTTKKEIINRNRPNYEILYKDFHPKINGLPFKKAFFLSSFDQQTGTLNPILLSNSLFNLMYKVNKSVLIQTPYLLPTKPFYKLLKNLVHRNINIAFITNSNCSTDVMPISAVYDNQKRKLEKLGIDLYEFTGPDYLHSKSGVFDDKIALIGSYNFDPRSANINTELVFIIEDETIAQKLKEIINEDQKQCVKVVKNDSNSFGGYYGCYKTGPDMILYVLFRLLAHNKLLYNQF